ncbi:MAG: glycoside-pentoside-hexuronide (GPH):cation symporter, partial [Acetatifactor sp.]|nr:glycoside-pentoside-hexuronide (GPH):cation symporter [Acetatifactor sp.]
ILLIARVFDAFNDPIMGIVVAKTKTRWGKFRPWLFIGTVTNAIVLFIMFAAPPALDGTGLIAYAAVTYILWGVTYTMMDIPYWSMVPAFTEAGKERESLSALARSCAGVGSAIITIITVASVSALGTLFAGEGASDKVIERVGFKYFALIAAVLFVLFTVITCVVIKEKSTVEIKNASVGDMFKALVQNDQAMTMVIAIVMVNTSVYITFNLLIYFFKYDLAGESWKANYTLFNTFGGAYQILAMMLFFPLLRRLFNSMKLFYICIVSAVFGYLVLLVEALAGARNVGFFLIPGFFIFSAVGMLNVIVTVFLANTVDYGELKNNRRDESVIFSMQTFVVKLASGVAALIASLALSVFHISSDENAVASISASSIVGLRMTMTVLPVVVLLIAVVVFKKKYILSDEKLREITLKLLERKQEEK